MIFEFLKKMKFVFEFKFKSKIYYNNKNRKLIKEISKSKDKS